MIAIEGNRASRRYIFSKRGGSNRNSAIRSRAAECNSSNFARGVRQCDRWDKSFGGCVGKACAITTVQFSDFAFERGGIRLNLR